ncbi:band 7 [Micractinium conductrix]|uniref:Band 7 n=1 Tax=Micractinium conductrix TaxID=554055 RepID=A0A2P6V0V7_9CHLO|nr:band 7 [Micractinium conductrix]|eukprot:PSC67722.1 band 7 [Micractinium conductrix]
MASLRAAAWLLVLLAAAAGGARAAKCGFRAGGDVNACPGPADCCSIYGFCGTGPRFCGAGRCLGGRCEGAAVTKPPGCDATCAAAAAEGKKAAAVCRSGYRITKVQAPAYGLAAAGCNSPNAYAVVSRLCLGQRACYVAASDVQFGGDPCPQAAAPKRLAFTYTCQDPLLPVVTKPQPKPQPKPQAQPKPQVQAQPKPQPKNTGMPAMPAGFKGTGALEGRRAVARCATGEVIKEISMSYFGRTRFGCKAPASYRVVASKCLGKQACTVKASNRMFGGNPCPALQMRKYLSFRYKCVKVQKPVPKPAPKPVPKPAPKPVPKPKPKPAPKPKPSSGGGGGVGNVPPGSQTSLLWGQAGERWSPYSRVPDLSYSGYMANEKVVPTYAVRVDVRDLGAKGDGITDDTDAFQAAIDEATRLAQLLTTEPCGTTRRCEGFGNEGTQGVAILAPAGTYRITRMLEIWQSNVVLRGEGIGRTTLYYPKALQHIYGNEMQWAYMGGFLVLHGRNFMSDDTQWLLSDLTAGATKGQRRLQVGSTRGIEEGQWVRIFARTPGRTPADRRGLLAADPLLPQANRSSSGSGGDSSSQPLADARRPLPASGASTSEEPGTSSTPSGPSTPSTPGGYLPMPAAFVAGQRDAVAMGLDCDEELGCGAGVNMAAADGTLDAYLYGENLASSARPYDGERIRFASRVSRVGPTWIELERPLPYDLRMEWRPAVYTFATPLQHSGFEDFTVKFKWDKYPAHMKAYGYNAFWLYGCANSWVRNVQIIDSDNGAEAQNSDFITMRGLEFDSTAPRGNKFTQYCDGHHGAWAAASSNVRITQFVFHTKFIHDLTMDVFAQECVYNNGRGVDISLDMHRSAVHNNLLSNIDVGLGTRPFASSGKGSKGTHSGANSTWWNIYSSRGATLYLPDCGYGPLLNWIGVYGPPEICLRPGKCLHGGDVESASVGAAVAGNATREAPAGEGGAQAAAGGDVEAAAVLPRYCPEMRWRTEEHPSGSQPGVQMFAPRDLFTAMVSTRDSRLGLRRAAFDVPRKLAQNEEDLAEQHLAAAAAQQLQQAGHAVGGDDGSCVADVEAQ